VGYARAVYAEFLNRKADDPRKAFFKDHTQFEEGPVNCTTKEAQGKTRDISGWVICEEIKACISYVNPHKCSKSSKVVNEVEKSRKIKVILDQLNLKSNKDKVLDTSKYPETLEHITLYDKGGKTYVTDAVFEFFIKVSSHIHENTSCCLLGSCESGCEDVLAEDTAGDDYEAAVTRISIDNPASRWHYPEVYGR
jgi:hypothetical protein